MTNRVLPLFCLACLSVATAPAFPAFDITDTGAAPEGAPEIQPWRVVRLDPDHGGLWAVAGDLDGDGAAEIVSAENFNEGDTHFTSAVAAQKLDGAVLWRWGRPDLGRKVWHHDVACQIHDWDGDGRNEVIVCDERDIVELDGATGAEKRRIPIPKRATDCLVFCDLSGAGRASDVLVKDRYDRIWAYDQRGRLLWDVRNPGGFHTAHQPRPMDLDGDGRDEIMAGYALLNPDGSVRWVYASKTTDLKRGHLDCARLMRAGKSPEEARIALTCCGANNLAVIDGTGAVVWELSGHHFESIQTGNILPGAAGPQILVDIDHTPRGESPLWVLDADGTPQGRIVLGYARHHRLLDWTGDGYDEIFTGDNRAVYDHTGGRIATLALPALENTAPPDSYETSILTGDCTGDGVRDVLVLTPDMVCIYENTKGKTPEPPAPLGTGPNVTLY